MIISVWKSTDIVPFAIFNCKSYSIQEEILTIHFETGIVQFQSGVWEFVTDFDHTYNEEECVDIFKRFQVYLSTSKTLKTK